jgi:hypothetical protein
MERKPSNNGPFPQRGQRQESPATQGETLA